VKVCETLHSEGFYLYYIQGIQHSEYGDMDRQLEFCLWLDAHPCLYRYISFFTDEEQFTRKTPIYRFMRIHTEQQKVIYCPFSLLISSKILKDVVT